MTSDLLSTAPFIGDNKSYMSIPHVTQFDEADITLLEDFRKSEISNSKATDYKLTILAFFIFLLQ